MGKIRAFVFFCLLTILVTWPLILHLNNRIIDSHDGLLITWYLNWDLHAISGGLTNPGNFYNANIFFPFKNTLAFSDFMLPQALLAAPFVWLSSEPLVAYNLNFLLGFALTAFATYLLVEHLTRASKVSLLAGTLFAFSTIHLSYMAHIQLFNFYPVIFALLFLFQKRYKLFILFFLISSLTTALFLYFLLASIAIYLLPIVYETFRPKAGDGKKKFTGPAAATAIGAILSALFLLPYFLVSRQFSYVRPINDAIHFSLQFPDLANIGAASRLHSFLTPVNSTPAYFGAVFLILLLVMLVELHQHPKTVPPKEVFKNVDFWLIVAGISLILALGPALHVFRNTVHIGPLPAIPLPYAIFYYLVPGFSGFRTPSRWIILTAFALCIAIALHFQKRINGKTAAALIFLIILEINVPLSFSQVPSLKEFPPEQVWLKNNYVEAPIIQFPIYNWDDPSTSSGQANTRGFGLETLREYYSTTHWHPMYNGYSGFSPVSWEANVKWLQKNFPSEGSIKSLSQLGIKLVIAPHNWQDRIRPLSAVELIKEFPDNDIYLLP